MSENKAIELEAFQVEEIRKQFPILSRKVHDKPLIYFDNAATTQKPQIVIDALSNYYQNTNANIHRGIHTVAEEATAAYEEVRKRIAGFINARSFEEIIFTRGTTEGLNLAAFSLGKYALKEGDEIVISTMEHHSNIVPWQMACQYYGATLKVIPISDNGELDMEAARDLISEKTKILAIVYASNALGTINPVRELIQMAREKEAYVVLDGAQSTAHFAIDVQELDCDLYAFSSHKIYGPTGIGVLYGKKELLEAMPPYQGGGEMIAEVSFEGTTYNELPYKFEAGTPNIADAIAFGACLDFWEEMDKQGAKLHEEELLTYATEKLKEIEGLQIIGQAKEKVSVVSFIVEGAHHQDLAVMLDNYGIAVRTGHHCTQPLMKRLNIPGTVRASFGLYNTKEEIDYFVEKLKKSISMVRG